AHSAKIVWRDDVMPEFTFVVVAGTSLDGCIASPGGTAERQSQRHSHRLHICLFPKPALNAVNRPNDLLSFRITNAGQQNMETDGMIGIEAGIHIFQPDETADQQTRAYHQHDR